MYQVLVPVDENEERSMRQVDYIASRCQEPDDVAITVFYVKPRKETSIGESAEFEDNETAVKTADALEDEGFSVERVSRMGFVSEEILDYAEENDVDEIVLGGRKRSGVAKLVLGSVSQDVILSTELPVVLAS